MPKVIDLTEYKARREQDDTGVTEGLAKCIDCQTEWVAVVESEEFIDVWLECPNCGMYKGRLSGNVEPDSPIWECRCGNELFYATPEGLVCPNCGTTQTGF